jgi:SAM-dependent methyltransferase
MKKDKIDLVKSRITYETFKDMASDKELSKYEKIGFPNDYREKYEESIFNNINTILRLDREGIIFFDVGCGCSELPKLIIKNAIKNRQNLYMIDSEEMLVHLPNKDNMVKISGKFPDEINLPEYQNKVDAIVLYSVLQHIVLDMNPFYFIDEAVKLLNDGGRLLIGDIPNISKRNRFFASNTGLKFHQSFTKTNTSPEYKFNTLIEDKIDDSLVFAILSRYRNAGFETYLLEQPIDLPMRNRREDILIVKN